MMVVLSVVILVICLTMVAVLIDVGLLCISQRCLFVFCGTYKLICLLYI